MRLSLTLMSLLALSIMALARGPNEPLVITDPEVRSTLAKLDSADLATRRQAFIDVSAKSEQLADGIAAILASEVRDEHSSRRALAAKWLARNSPGNGIPLMVRHVDFRPPNQVIDHLTPLAGYPCAEALVESGLDSIPAIFAHLRRTELEKVTDESIRLYAQIIHELYHNKYGASGLEAIDGVRSFAGRMRAHDTTNFQRLETELRKKGK